MCVFVCVRVCTRCNVCVCVCVGVGVRACARVWECVTQRTCLSYIQATGQRSPDSTEHVSAAPLFRTRSGGLESQGAHAGASLPGRVGAGVWSAPAGWEGGGNDEHMSIQISPPPPPAPQGGVAHLTLEVGAVGLVMHSMRDTSVTYIQYARHFRYILHAPEVPMRTCRSSARPTRRPPTASCGTAGASTPTLLQAQTWLTWDRRRVESGTWGAKSSPSQGQATFLPGSRCRPQTSGNDGVDYYRGVTTKPRTVLNLNPRP